MNEYAFTHTVSNLTVAESGRVVDSEGKTVTVVAAGETKVKGDSSLTVTVSGTYSTSYDSSKAGTTNAEKIDRSAFDSAFGTSTAFDVAAQTGGSTASPSTDASTSTSPSGTAQQNPFASWWDGAVSFWKGLFGMAQQPLTARHDHATRATLPEATSGEKVHTVTRTKCGGFLARGISPRFFYSDKKSHCQRSKGLHALRSSSIVIFLVVLLAYLLKS